MKPVLMVALHFPPVGGGGVYRTLGFARHLEGHGFLPVILTGSGGGAWVKDEALVRGVEHLETLRVGALLPAQALAGRVRRPFWQMAAGWLATRALVPDTYLRWRKPAVRAGLERLRRGDVRALYSTSPPDTDHMVALDLKRATGLPWVADFRDPWIGLGYFRPLTPWHRAAHLERLRAVLSNADRVLTATDGTRAFLEAALPSAAPRITVIPNGYEEEEWREVTPARFDRFTVVHAGRISAGRTLAPFLDGLQRFLAADPSRAARTQVLLYGPHDSPQAGLVERRGLGEVVRFVGQRPHREVLEAEAGAHALLLLKHLSGRFRELVPGKLYEYLASGRPVLAVVPEGPAAELVRTMGCGWVAAPGEPGRVAEALERAWKGEAPPRHSPADRSIFSRRRLTSRLAGVLEEIT
ncbi:MAG: glycosyltransferase [Candidatus Eisenbacteria bacterium]|nr:glycosyltransferase [Candidatus Eisenbacteria bacterium]